MELVSVRGNHNSRINKNLNADKLFFPSTDLTPYTQ